MRAFPAVCLGLVAVAACAVARTDPAGLTPQPDADPAGPRVAETSIEHLSSPVHGRASGIRTIGTCEEAERAKGTARFTLAHFNDLQARYSDRIDGKSRYAYIAGWLRRLKEETPATLVLDAGDDYEKGAVAEVRSMGESTRQMIQALPIDVRTIGNHDFAYGEQAVLRDVLLSQHPVLAANVRHTGLPDAEQPFEPFVRVDVGCVRVGVIGLVTQNYDADDLPTKKPFDGVFAHDARYAKVLAEQVAKHRDEVDVLVALTHIGLYDDASLVSQAGKGVDLVVGGHTEDLLRWPSPALRPDGSRAWIMQAGHFGQTLGRADLVVDLAKKKVSIERYAIVDVDASLPVADDVDALATRLEQEAAPDTARPIATTKAGVDRSDMPDLVWRAVKSEWKADALVLGKDLFWEGLPKGAVTLQRMYDAVLAQRQPTGTPGFSSLWIVELSGSDLATYVNRVGRGGVYAMYAPAAIDRAARYKVAIDKRAYTYPRTLFGTTKLPEGTLGGELIDVLEAYARTRTANGQPLD